jgi:hypothetical protein
VSRVGFQKAERTVLPPRVDEGYIMIGSAADTSGTGVDWGEVRRVACRHQRSGRGRSCVHRCVPPIAAPLHQRARRPGTGSRWRSCLATTREAATTGAGAAGAVAAYTLWDLAATVPARAPAPPYGSTQGGEPYCHAARGGRGSLRGCRGCCLALTTDTTHCLPIFRLLPPGAGRRSSPWQAAAGAGGCACVGRASSASACAESGAAGVVLSRRWGYCTCRWRTCALTPASRAGRPVQGLGPRARFAGGCGAGRPGRSHSTRRGRSRAGPAWAVAPWRRLSLGAGALTIHPTPWPHACALSCMAAICWAMAASVLVRTACRRNGRSACRLAGLGTWVPVGHAGSSLPWGQARSTSDPR